MDKRLEILLLILLLPFVMAAYDPPIGIPAPPFGIDETYRGYDVAGAHTRNGGLVYQVSAGGGFFTHYVDNTDGATTDVDNEFGSIAKPRETIPTTLPAGSVVEVQGGPYTVVGDEKIITSSGTEASPVYLRGVGDPELAYRLSPQGTYFIIEGFLITRTEKDAFNVLIFIDPSDSHPGPVDFLSIRDCEIDGGGVESDNNGIAIFTDNSTDMKTNIVIYDNLIHNHGDWTIFDTDDAHGIWIGPYTDYVWVLDNEIHHNSGDGFHIDDTVSNTTHFSYCGRNLFNEGRENAIDIKRAQDVIISENICYGYAVSNESNGDAIRISDAENQDHVYVIYNTVYDSVIGINPDQGEGDPDEPPYIIGNEVYNCSGFGIDQEAGWVINNTVYSCDKGIRNCDNVINNIFHNCATYHISNCTNADYNLLWQDAGVDGGDIVIVDESPPSTTPTNTIEQDPLMVGPARQKFALTDDSPAKSAGISTGTVQTVFDTFESRYGIDIKVDIRGYPRSSNWEMGANEYIQFILGAN
ncbi:right-handed parallel beta-helix repeat-containing protein [Candidatus Pacearchaeota archaeon]|nr:right-handed parallel beta-helix repeat-containing protein [Candidatus Pacearchaeota archaeon]